MYKGRPPPRVVGVAPCPTRDGRTVFAAGRVVTADGKKLRRRRPEGKWRQSRRCRGRLGALARRGHRPGLGREEKKPLPRARSTSTATAARSSRCRNLERPDRGRPRHRPTPVPDPRREAPGGPLRRGRQADPAPVRPRRGTLLEKSEVDYLFVSSRAPASAWSGGEKMRYALQVKSRKGA